MNKLLRLALALFMSLNVLYADENDIKLEQVREYKYNTNGEVSVIDIYDSDEILRTRETYFYDKGILISHYNFTNGKDSRLFKYEYSNGKLIKMYEAEWTTHKPIKSTESIMNEFEYNRYGNLVCRYVHTTDPIEKVWSGKIVPVLYKTKYEYENGKLIWAILFIDDILKYKTKCVYDSEQKLVEEKTYREDDQAIFEVKYRYDGNRLSYSTLRGRFNDIEGKTKYEYDSNGKLIRKLKYGTDLTGCRPFDIFAK